MNDQTNSKIIRSGNSQNSDPLEKRLVESARSIEVSTTTIDWNQIGSRLDQRQKKRKRRRRYILSSGMAVGVILLGLGIWVFGHLRFPGREQIANQFQTLQHGVDFSADSHHVDPVDSGNARGSNSEFPEEFDRQQFEAELAKIRALNAKMNHLHTMHALQQQIIVEERALYQSVRKRMSTEYLSSYSDSF